MHFKQICTQKIFLYFLQIILDADDVKSRRRIQHYNKRNSILDASNET